jgi:hypothetical protein
MNVILTDKELAMCDMIAAMRFWKGCSSNTTIIDKRKANGIGFVAEYAFSKQFNLHLDILSSLDKDSFDFISKDGSTIDIKATDKFERQFIGEESTCMTYMCLAIVDGNAVYLIGYATKQMLLDEGQRDFGYGPTYFVKRRDLKTW